MAVGAISVQQAPQLVVGELERIFPLPLECLKVELTLQVDLVFDQPGTLHHEQQQWQQRLGIAAGAFEAEQGAIFCRLTAQPSAAAFDEIRQRIAAEIPATSAQHTSQELRGTPLTAPITATAAPHP
jgi:hypothetical protein